jgi:hypothetical protein
MKMPPACLRVINPSDTESISLGAKAKQITGMDSRAGGVAVGAVVLNVTVVSSASIMVFAVC